jgi:hypothetical protein
MTYVRSTVAGLVFAVALGASGVARADDATITYPDPGDEMAIADGLMFQVGPIKGATDLQCTITQGGAKWTENLSGGSSACDPDRKLVAKKFKPGPATLAVRMKVRGAWTKTATIKVTLIAKKPEVAARACNGPKCNRVKKHTPKTGTEAGFPPPASLKQGDRQPASWDSTYTADQHESHGGFLSCPTSHHFVRGVKLDKIHVKHGKLSFIVELTTGSSDTDPRAIATLTASINPDGSISGTSSLSADNMAYLKQYPPAFSNSDYKLDRHKTFKITGQMTNADDFALGSVYQGRVMSVAIDNKSLLTIASGSASPDGCEFSAKAGDFLHGSYENGEQPQVGWTHNNATGEDTPEDETP